jgi:hypothetical protein
MTFGEIGLLILWPLLLTQLIELPLSLLFAKENPPWERLLSVFALNCLTNPALNFLLLLSAKAPTLYYSTLIGGEAAVCLLEAGGLRLLLNRSRKQAFTMSLVLNATSFLTGLLLNRLL